MVELSELWVILILSIVIVGILIRYVIFKVTGKVMDDGDDSPFTSLRKKVSVILAKGYLLKQIEETDGREAVRTVIKAEIKEIISNAEALTQEEKDLFNSIHKTFLLRYIENELIKIGILKPEEEPKKIV